MLSVDVVPRINSQGPIMKQFRELWLRQGPYYVELAI